MNYFDIYNKRKTSLRCGMTVGLMWDVPEPPVSIYGHPTSEAGFPLLHIDGQVHIF